MKTIVFVLALAAAPVLFAQVATPITLFDSPAYARSSQVALAGDRVFVAAEVANWGSVVLNVDAHGATSQAGYVFAGGSVSAPVLALGKVFYQGGIGPVPDLRCSDGNWQTDRAIDGATFGLPEAEAHGFAYGVSHDPVANQTLIGRTDGVSVDSFSVAIAGSYEAMTVLGDKLIVAVREGWSWYPTALNLYAIDAAGTSTLIHAGVDPGTGIPSTSAGVLLGVLGDELMFVDTHPSGPAAQVWKTNGTAAGTQLVRTMPVSMIAGRAQVLGATMYFAGANSASRMELWRTDGTASGTTRMTEWETDGVLLGARIRGGDSIYFATQWGATYSLWSISPDATTPALIYRDTSGTFGTRPLFFADGALFLRDSGEQTWRFDIGSGRLFDFKPRFEGNPETRMRDILAVIDSHVLVTDNWNRLCWLDLSAARSNQGDSGCAADGANHWPILALGCLLTVAAARRRRGVTSGRPAAARAGTFMLVVAPALAGAARTPVKTIVFVLALAAAPVLLAQVARPVAPAGQALIAATPVTAVSGGQNVYVAVYTDFGMVVARIDAQRAITQGSRLFPYGVGDICPATVSLALGRVFYRRSGEFRSSDGTSLDDVAIVGAGPSGGAVVEAHGWAYFASETGDDVLIRRTDGFTVDSFSASLPGQLADMRAVNGRLLVATRAPTFTIHAIDMMGGVTPLYSGTAPQSGTVMGVLGHGLVFSDRDSTGLWRLGVTDGMPAGAHIVPDVYVFGEPRNCLVHDGAVYFMAPSAAGFDEAWRTDGTYHNTRRLTAWGVDGPILGKAVIHDGVVYFMTTWAARHSLWRVGPEYPGALRVYHSEPQPFYAEPEFVAGGRIYLRDTQNRLWRSEPTPTSFQLAAVSFAGNADATLDNVLAVFGNMAVVTDQQNRLWTVDFSEPQDDVIDESGCVAGARRQWPAPALGCLLATWVRRRRMVGG